MLSFGKFFRKFLFSLDGNCFVRLFTVVNWSYWRMPICITYSDADRTYTVYDRRSKYSPLSRVVFSRKERIWVYAKGVKNRIERLGHIYGIESCNFCPGDTVIDCGANIGEFSLLMRDRYAAHVISVEPESEEARCIPYNLPTALGVVNAALWYETTELKFYSKNRSADSSIFEIANYDAVTTVKTFSLDDLFERYGLNCIKLLKLEAEGAEPEILKGAARSLRFIEYISADLGPERGMKQESTVVPVCNHLFAMGFELVSVYPKRQVYLFRNCQWVAPS